MLRSTIRPASLAFLFTASLISSVASAADDAKDAPPPHHTTAPAAANPNIKKITVEEFDKQRTEKDTVVVDVRTPEEFAAGHVPGAVNIPVAGPGSDDFDQRVKQLDKDKTYLVHCARGGRSAAATNKMQKLGVPRLEDFSGGMEAWKKADKPVEKGESTTKPAK